MKKHFGLALVVSLVVLSALNFSCEKMSCALKSDLPWCPSTLKDADNQFLAGNYENAINLYQAYLADKPSESKIGLVKNKISDSYYNLGEKAFTSQNWTDAINFYSQSQNVDSQNKTSKCYFNLGEEYFAKGDYQAAIDNYSKSKEPGVQEKIQAAQDALQPVEPVQPPAAPGTTPPAQPAKTAQPTDFFVVKVGVFPTRADANVIADELRARGIPVYKNISDAGKFVVFAGSYATREKAQVALGKIKAISKKYRFAYIAKRDKD